MIMIPRKLIEFACTWIEMDVIRKQTGTPLSLLDDAHMRIFGDLDSVQDLIDKGYMPSGYYELKQLLDGEHGTARPVHTITKNARDKAIINIAKEYCADGGQAYVPAISVKLENDGVEMGISSNRHYTVISRTLIYSGEFDKIAKNTYILKNN